MRAREPRRRVMVRARMRSDCGWHDATIRNISSRGLMVQTAARALRGTYVEVRRGRHVIVGRVAWSEGDALGLHTQDRVPVDDVIAEADVSGINFSAAKQARPEFDRRAVRRPEPGHRAERSRHVARVAEYASTALLAALLVGSVATAAVHALGGPMARITAALSPE